MSGPKETQDAWLTVVPVSTPKCVLASRISQQVPAAESIPALLSSHLPPTRNFSSPWTSLPPTSHSYITLPFGPFTLLVLLVFLSRSWHPLPSLNGPVHSDGLFSPLLPLCILGLSHQSLAVLSLITKTKKQRTNKNLLFNHTLEQVVTSSFYSVYKSWLIIIKATC